MKNGGGHFAPELGGHFKLELGGQYYWNLHKRLLSKIELEETFDERKDNLEGI